MYEENLIDSSRPFSVLYHHLPILFYLNILSKKKATLLLTYLDNNTLEVICNIVANVVSNKSFSDQRSIFKDELEYFDKELKALTNTDIPIEVRKKILLQISPLIFVFLSTAIPLLIKSCQNGLGK